MVKVGEIGYISAKPNGSLLSTEVKDQLDDAAVSTSKAFSAVRRSRANDQHEEEPKSPAANIDDMLADKTKVCFIKTNISL